MNSYTYTICNVASDLGDVDFSDVLNTSSATTRTSTDGTLFVLKYKTTPTVITNGTITPSQTLNHSQCLTLMATAAWSGSTE
jgi:hypothetical protein